MIITEEEFAEVCRERDVLQEELDDARKALSDYSINIINVPLAGGVRELARRADQFQEENEKLAAFLSVADEQCAYFREKVEKYEADLEAAAGELPMALPEPGSDMAKLMAANILLRRENEKLRHAAVDVDEAVAHARKQVACDVINSLMPVGPLTNAMPSRYLALVEEYITDEFSITEEDIEVTFKHEFDRRNRRQQLEDRLRVAERERDEARDNLAEASKLWDGPETSDWFEGVRKEAAHQVARWGVEHDAGKGAEHWFWLIGYLAGKALRSAMEGDVEKAKHHTISTGAALLGWHARLCGVATQFRPGIEPPEGEADA